MSEMGTSRHEAGGPQFGFDFTSRLPMYPSPTAPWCNSPGPWHHGDSFDWRPIPPGRSCQEPFEYSSVPANHQVARGQRGWEALNAQPADNSSYGPTESAMWRGPGLRLFSNLDSMIDDWTPSEVSRGHRLVRLVPEVCPGGQVLARAETITDQAAHDEASIACLRDPINRRHVVAAAEVGRLMLSIWGRRMNLSWGDVRTYLRRKETMCGYGSFHAVRGEPLFSTFSALGRAACRGNGQKLQVLPWTALQPLVRGMLEFVRACSLTAERTTKLIVMAGTVSKPDPQAGRDCKLP